MSEKYFNAYVDSAVGAIHEYVGLTLQLKAQLRVANEMLAEKEKDFASTQEQIASLENEKNAAIAESQRQLIEIQNELHALRGEKAQSASALENEVYTLRNRLSEIDQWKDKARVAEEQLLAMANKVKHMDTLTKQFNDLKAQLLAVSKEYEDAKTRISELEEASKAPKKVINNKTSSTSKATVTKPKETNIDDF